MTALGWALIHFLWQGAVVALVLALALGAMRRATPQMRYAAACLALITMAACVPATSLLLNSGDKLTLPPGEKGLVLDTDLAAASYPDWQSWVVICWAAGATALLMRTVMGWHVARRNSRRGIEWDYPLSQLMERMRMSGTVELVVSRLADAPQVFGWLKPVILVPASAIARLSPAEMEAVLAHELAHIVRRDYLVNLIQVVIESLLFYHPAVWWVTRRIRQEREHCCDDMAVEVCGDRRRYSRALLKLEESRPALAMAATAGGMGMRIARLLGYPAEGAAWGPGVAAAGAALLLGSLLWASQPPAPPPPPPPAPAAAEEAPAPPASATAPHAPVAPKVELAAAPAPVAAPAAPPQAAPAPQSPPPPPPAPLAEWKTKSEQQRALSEEVRERMAVVRAQFQAQKAEMHLDQERMREDVKRELERALKDLQLNKQQLEVNIKEAVEKARLQLNDVNVQKEAQASMERALAELKAREPEIRKNIEQAMSRLDGELKEMQGQFQKQREERERRTAYADQKWSKGDVKGSTTAKGRHYLRYGPPDEIESHAGKGENWLYRNWRGTGGKMIFEFDADGQLKK